MKKIFLITYDFENGKIPDAFGDTLQDLGPWWHYIYETWLIATEMDIDAIRERFQPFMRKGVHLLIVEMGRQMTGWLPKEAWEWIREHRGNQEKTESLAASA